MDESKDQKDGDNNSKNNNKSTLWPHTQVIMN